MNEKARLSIVIPAYNEEKRIRPSLKRIIDYSKKHFKDYEILVVDDCSKDSTNKIVSKYKQDKVRVLRNEHNRGKGYSVKRGMIEAKYPLVLFSDSDLATPIEEVSKFIGFIEEGYEIVIASRNLRGSDVRARQPWYRQKIGKMFPLFVNLIALRGFKDTQCGFKLFKTDVARKIVKFQTFDRFCFDVELLFIAKKAGYKIKEAPVVWFDKAGSKVNFLKDGFNMLIDLFRIRYNNLIGKYEVK
jgi:dolichyl-phosphate beta-glucosyltransferase